MPARRVSKPTPQRLPPLPAHLARLSLWQCPPRLPQSRLSWPRARYELGPATGAIISSIMSQTSRDAWENKRERDTERERGGKYALTSFPLSVLSLSHSRCPKSARLTLLYILQPRHNQLLLSRWRDCSGPSSRTSRLIIYSIQSKFFHFFPNEGEE